MQTSDSGSLVRSASSVTHGYQGPEGRQSHAETYARSKTKEPVCLSTSALRVRAGQRGRLFRAKFGTLGQWNVWRCLARR